MRRFTTSVCIAVLLAFGGISAASAALITFTATGNENISGFVQMDEAVFDGTSFQFISNSSITDLFLTVFGSSFSLADVVTSDSTIIDSTGPVARIVNGQGLLAENALNSIAFYPDGFGGTDPTGDASLAFGGLGFENPTYYAVQWVVTPPTSVPEPGTLGLLGLAALLGVFARRRRTV